MPSKHRGAALDPAGGLRDEAHDRVAGDGLAGAGFADDAERLAPFEGEAHAVDRAIDAVARVESGAEVFDGEQRHEVEEGPREEGGEAAPAGNANGERGTRSGGNSWR
jgi:hypothetical protein